jgi:hypothetical protein
MTPFDIKFFQGHTSGFSLDVDGKNTEEEPSSKRARHV